MSRTATLERPDLAFKVASHDIVADAPTEVREDEGVVTAVVSVTGVVDEVDDVIEPGAYRETLTKRNPKVCWAHSWDQPIGRVLHIKELSPGDPDLPSKTRDGKPWPQEAGALIATMQFNMKSDRGREAFQAVRFYSESGECEWSIGYQVVAGKARRDAKGIRHIKALNLFELSVVLFGANALSGTLSLKTAVAVMHEHADATTITWDEVKSTLDRLGFETRDGHIEIKADSTDDPEDPPAENPPAEDPPADAPEDPPVEPAAPADDQPADDQPADPPAADDAADSGAAAPDDQVGLFDDEEPAAADAQEPPETPADDSAGEGTTDDDGDPVPPTDGVADDDVAAHAEVPDDITLPDAQDPPEDPPQDPPAEPDDQADEDKPAAKALRAAKALPTDADTGIEDTCPGCHDAVVFDTMNGWMRLDGSYSHDDGSTHSQHLEPPEDFVADDEGYYTRSAGDSPTREGKAEGGADQNRGNAEELRRWYVHGEGAAKIRWGTDGDFMRCVRIAGKHMDPERAKGYCANRHHDALGVWPGQEKSLTTATGRDSTAPDDQPEPPDSDDSNTGVMVALYPDEAAAEKIAVRGGTAPEDLHITLAYLGDVDDDAGQDNDLTLGGSMDRIMAAAQSAAATHQPISGSVGGIGKFPDGGDGVPVWTPVDVVGLGALRESVVEALADSGLPVKTDHGFTPHMTLGYNLDLSLITPVDDVHVEFDALVIAVGDAHALVRLGADVGGDEAQPGDPTPPPPEPSGPSQSQQQAKAAAYDPTIEVGPDAGNRPAKARQRKDFPRLEGTFEERQQTLHNALTEALCGEYDGDDENPASYYLGIEGTWPDRVIVTVHEFAADRSQSYEVAYSIDDDGSVELGEPTPVRLTVTSESLDEDDDEGDEVPVGDLLPLSEMVETVTAGFKTLDATEVKAGRVLSASNATRLRSAVEHLIHVLAQAGIEVGEDAESQSSPVPDTETTAPSARDREQTKTAVVDDDGVEIDMSEFESLVSSIDEITSDD